MTMSGMRNPINDARMNYPNSSLEVVYDGSLTLWRTGANLDALIMNHDDLKVLEIIAYHPALNLEAPRIYVDATKLRAMFNQEEFEKKLAEKKEFFIKRRKEYILSILEKEVFNTMAANFVTLRISEDRKVEKQFAIAFAIFLQPKFGDTLAPPVDNEGMTESMKAMSAITGQAPDGSRLDVIVEKPHQLVPVNTQHYHKLRASIFMNCLAQFEEHTRFLQTSNERAMQLLTLAQSVIDAFLPKYLRMNYNAARLRWVKAINRVLYQNLWLKIRALLLKRQLEEMDLSSSTTASATGRLGCMSTEESLLSPRGMQSAVASPRGVNKKLSPMSIRAAVTGIFSSGSGSNCSSPTSRRMKGKVSRERSMRLEPSKDQIFTDGSRRLTRAPSKHMKMQSSKKAKELESDAEVSALLNGVSSLMPAAVNKNLPRYAQSTISRFLMINDSFDMVGVNRTIAPAVGGGKITTAAPPPLMMPSSASIDCFIDVEEHKDSEEEDDTGLDLLLAHSATAPAALSSLSPPFSLPPLQVA